MAAVPVPAPDPLPRELQQGADLFSTERPPQEAELTLVVTGAREPAFDAVAGVLVRELRAERLVLPGAGHVVQNAPGFNQALLEFTGRA